MNDSKKITEQNTQLKDLCLWSFRRLPNAYKPYVCEEYKKVTGEDGVFWKDKFYSIEELIKLTDEQFKKAMMDE